MTQKPFAGVRSVHLYPLAVCAVGLLGIVWAWWTTLGQMALHWSQNPLYSHGYLVPGFALLLLWLRRERLPALSLTPSWWGVALLAAGLAVRGVGTFYYLDWVDQVSLVPCLAGLVVAVGGWRAWCWAWPAIAFLLFMVPLPYRFSLALTAPLQGLATVCSTFLLQTLALPAIADGNVIRLNDVEINIVEACSGLRMLVIFFALSTGVALVIRRKFWEKLVLVGSAVPIAVVVNVLRITVTGVLHETAGSEVADAVFHDLAGWLMMPVALVFMAVELKLLSRLVIDPNAAPGPRFSPPRPPSPPSASAGRPRPGTRRKWQPVGAAARPGGLA
jgi:exosortase